MGNTSIEWTNKTWNPIRGCSRVSEGCLACYAEGIARRFSGSGLAYEGLVRIGSDGKPHEWNGRIQFVEEHLLDPLKWKKPARIFVNSMSDLFHENVTDEMRDRIFAVMALCPQHTFQVLTKRPAQMLEYFAGLKDVANKWAAKISKPFTSSDVLNLRWLHWRMNQGPAFPYGPWPLPNVHLGVSCENQATADERIPLLLQTPAATRFISAEPLLGPIDLRATEYLKAIAAPGWQGEKHYPFPGMDDRFRTYFIDLLDWVIVGGESGPGARPLRTEWIESLVDQCKVAGVACFVKQLGANVIQGGEHRIKRDKKGADMHEWPHEIRVREFPEEAVTTK